MIALVVTALFCASLGSSPDTEQAKPSATPTEMVESFLTGLGSADVDQTFSQLFAGSPLNSQPTQLQVLKGQTQSALSVYGKPLGVELYKEQKFGESLVRLIYIQRLANHPLVWKFWIYRVPAGWQVNAVIFNDQFNFE